MLETTVSAKVGRYLAGLADRLKDNSNFMAYVLSVYQTQERLDDRTLAEHLGTTLDMLSRLALCTRPAAESAQFADQVRQIAAYASADPAMTANTIRQVSSLEGLAKRPEAVKSERLGDRQLYSEAGLLAAARDHSETDNYQSAASEEESSMED